MAKVAAMAKAHCRHLFYLVGEKAMKKTKTNGEFIAISATSKFQKFLQIRQFHEASFQKNRVKAAER